MASFEGPLAPGLAENIALLGAEDLDLAKLLVQDRELFLFGFRMHFKIGFCLFVCLLFYGFCI